MPWRSVQHNVIHGRGLKGLRRCGQQGMASIGMLCMAMVSVYETIKISISDMPALKAYPILLISFVKWFSFTFFQENISENTDNIVNLPERKAIIRLEKEAKRLEEAKRLCLDQNDPRYKKLWICLVFFKL